MTTPVFSNILIYRAIVGDAIETMQKYVEMNRRPKEDGSPGWILQLEPGRVSFKQAMIAIVFTGMWLEALLHLLIVRRFDESKFKELDRAPYEEKLESLGVNNQDILQAAKNFRKTRREIVHEKAYFDNGEMKFAQDEALAAYKLLLAVESIFSKEE